MLAENQKKLPLISKLNIAQTMTLNISKEPLALPFIIETDKGTPLYFAYSLRELVTWTIILQSEYSCTLWAYSAAIFNQHKGGK